MTKETEKPAEAYIICHYAAKYSDVALAGVQLLSFQNGNIIASLEAGQNGRTILQYRAPWGGGAERLQGLVLTAGEYIVVEIMISRDKRSVFVNQEELRGDSSDQLVPASVKPRGEKPRRSWVPLATRAKKDIFPLVERRYLQKIEAVEMALAAPSEAAVINAFSSLRLMFLEGFLDSANGKYRLKLRFSAREHDPPPIAAEYAHSRLPVCARSCEPMDTKRFLKMGALTSKGNTMSVRDLIRFAANSLGEHHFESADDSELSAHYDKLRVQGTPSMLRTMIELLEIFLVGVQPLTEAILHDRS